MKNLIAVAVDDEPKALDVIKMHAEKIPFLRLQKTFRDAPEAVAWINANAVDLIFLDINMPNLSGLAFRQLIGKSPMIIFTTAYSEYALESYEYSAVDYLLKPIRFQRFFSAVLKAREQQQTRQGTPPQPQTSGHKGGISQHNIFVKSGPKTYKIDSSDIFYLEKDGNYVYFHTREKKIMSRLNMQQLKELLPDNDFMKVHKSYIIALQHIDIIETHQVTICGKKIPVAKSYREKLMEKLKSQ